MSLLERDDRWKEREKKVEKQDHRRGGEGRSGQNERNQLKRPINLQPGVNHTEAASLSAKGP